MKILLTGTTGYIAKSLLPVLLSEGHEVVCCVRDRKRFDVSGYDSNRIHVIEVDFLNRPSLNTIPNDIDAAYYLIHSMSSSIGKFEAMEKESAANFREQMSRTRVKQVIYLSGIVNTYTLSRHLSSRKAVEEVLKEGHYHLTTLRAGIIVGSGSASFEIIRDLVEKLPVMIVPKWVNTKSQPIAIKNVIQFLKGVLLTDEALDRSFDIGGPEILTYKEMLLTYADVRKLKRLVFVVPVMTPKLSSYWLYFITSISYKLAVNLVNSMKVEIVGNQNNLHQLLNIDLITYREAVLQAFGKIELQTVISNRTDASSDHSQNKGISDLINVPSFGCFKDKRARALTDENLVLDRIWSIGGETGWYYASWFWGVRGFIDKLFGGVGLRRRRKDNTVLSAGDSLDFWRVLLADRKEKRMLLYAEMNLPGEAWLEFTVKNNTLYQTATFRPLGLWGRIYWYSVLPFHNLIFRGMVNRIAKT